MGANFSWIFVDGVSRKDLLAALDLGLTGKSADPLEMGTSSQPLAVASFGGWQAVFAKYSIMLDATIGTDPPRLLRLPPASRCVSCVVLEHAMVSYASLWTGGRHVWEIRHDGGDHLAASGELPDSFAGIRAEMEQKQRLEIEQRPHQSPNSLRSMGVDYIFGIPLKTAMTITGYRYLNDDEDFQDAQHVQPINGNNLMKLGKPPKWWQLTNSIEYEE
jgi:hypothetical protein